MKYLFLDDSPDRQAIVLARCPSTEIVSTARECIAKLSELWDLVSLDHDLGGEIYVDSAREDTGMEVVRWMVENRPQIGLVMVHTFNGGASKTMADALESAGYKVARLPFNKVIWEDLGRNSWIQ